MATKELIEDVFIKISNDLNITEEQFDSAEAEYKKIGEWIDKSTSNRKIEIYPQGSFALGTVVKPINREDEYDIDLVCEYSKGYDLSAKELKSEVQSILQKYSKYKDENLIEKRRCWQITYEDCKKFHLDVIPAINKDIFIDITDKEDGRYNYIPSNPKGYMEWFKKRQLDTYKKIKENMQFQAQIEEVKEYKIRTPLQQAIQILKRHRDIMFANDKNNCKPISILITTIAATLYNHEPTIVATLTSFLDNVEGFINDSKKDGKYYIQNPSYTGGKEENFADKWNEHPERAAAFLKWIKQVKQDFNLKKLLGLDLVSLGNHIKVVLGEKTGVRVFKDIAEEQKKKILENNLKIDVSNGNLSTKGTIPVPRNHHYGKIL